MINHAVRSGIATTLVLVLLFPNVTTAQQVAVIGITDVETAGVLAIGEAGADTSRWPSGVPEGHRAMSYFVKDGGWQIEAG